MTRRRIWTAVAVLAVVAIGIVLAVALTRDNGSSNASIPPFRPAPGKYRIVPHPTSGAPAPQRLIFDGRTVLFTLGDVSGSGSNRSAGMSIVEGHHVVPYRRYRAGDQVAVGDIRVRVDGVYGSGERHAAVDVTLGMTLSSRSRVPHAVVVRHPRGEILTT